MIHKDALILEIKNLKKNFGNLEVLKGISQKISRGQVSTVIGPSGSGKSTLLRCINLIEKPDEGELILNGVDILKELNPSWIYKEIGMVFQSFNLFPNKTVMQNLILAPVIQKIFSKKEALEYAREILNKFNIIDKENEYPSKLSGGQSQRVAIARALCMKPKLILFDEPTSALDIEMVKEVLDVIRKLRDDNMTMIIVTHLMSFAKEISDEIIFMDEGLIVERAKDLFQNPVETRTKDFLSKIL